ncbi:hypothetical protein QFZ77_001960 [Paenibacillus sp. V4I3]|nr:hypothetical protein [Paenibacillus sp. V4I3]MDQ0890784.1 hypothetical protein [Paenibacillus sp. V4I9]
MTKSKMGIGIPVDVEDVRALEYVFVMIGRANPDVDHLSGS